MQLFHRDVLDDLRKFILTPDVVVVHGARQVGKTCLLQLIERELQSLDKVTLYVDLEDMRMLSLFNEGPTSVITYLRQSGVIKDSRIFLLIDEIQYLSNPSNLIKLLRDHHSNEIKLIVSGSSSFEIKSKFRDSLAGRTVEFELFPLSFREFLRFREIEIHIDDSVTSPPLIEKLRKLFTEFVLYGGYPRVVLEPEVEIKEKYLSQVIGNYIRKDIRDLANVRDIYKFNRLLEILASQCSQLLNVSDLASDSGISRVTIDKYLFILEQTYVLQLIRPFSRNIRSELFKMPKVFFYDNGIAGLLALKGFPRTVSGNMLENTIFGELRKSSSVGEFFYWRTKDGKEIDFIVPDDEDFIPVEVKMKEPRKFPTSIRYFREYYSSPRTVCIVLRKGEGIDGIEIRYPWESFNLDISPEILSQEKP